MPWICFLAVSSISLSCPFTPLARSPFKFISIWCWVFREYHLHIFELSKNMSNVFLTLVLSLYIQGNFFIVAMNCAECCGLPHLKIAFLRPSCLPLKSSLFIDMIYLHPPSCLVALSSPLILFIPEDTEHAMCNVTMMIPEKMSSLNLIFKGKPVTRLASHAFPSYTQNILYCKNAWMDESYVLDWVEKVLRPWVKTALMVSCHLFSHACIAVTWWHWWWVQSKIFQWRLSISMEVTLFFVSLWIKDSSNQLWTISVRSGSQQSLHVQGCIFQEQYKECMGAWVVLLIWRLWWECGNSTSSKLMWNILIIFSFIFLFITHPFYFIQPCYTMGAY